MALHRSCNTDSSCSLAWPCSFLDLTVDGQIVTSDVGYPAGLQGFLGGLRQPESSRGRLWKQPWFSTDFHPFLLPGNMTTPLLEAELLPERKGLPAFSGHVFMSQEQCCSAGLCHLEGNPAS